MRLKKIIVIIGLLLMGGIGICVMCCKEEKIMQDMNSNGISKIVMYFPGDNQTTITEYEYIEKYVNLFKSMKAQKSFGDTTIGHTYSIDIQYKDGTESNIAISSKKIIYNGIGYKASKDYCDQLYELYRQVADKSLVEDEIDISDIGEIRIHNSKSYLIVSKQDDMQKIIDEFKAMNLKETSKRNTSDYVYRIDIYYKDDGFDCIEIRESDVEILGIHYETDIDYCSKWKESFEQLSKVYAIN